MVRPVPILIADGHTVSNAPDIFRPPPQLILGRGTARKVPRVLAAFAIVITAAFPSVA
jgi:hypothetical protein